MGLLGGQGKLVLEVPGEMLIWEEYVLEGAKDQGAEVIISNIAERSQSLSQETD